jgi:nitrate reductase (cytochrome), electron transfer subunit
VPHRDIGPKSVVVRAVQILLVAVIGMAFVGMIVGMRQGATVYVPAAPVYEPVADHPGAVPATAYRDFDRRQFGPNRNWQSSLADLGPPRAQPSESDPHEFTPWDEEVRQELLAQRAGRRAFDGAPPVVPHPIDQMGVASCLACHADGRQIAGIRVPQMSHGFMGSCTQCHVEQQSTELHSTTTVINQFRALQARLSGSRAWEGAPPTIPHTTFLRDNCLSCHGAGGPEPIRSTHPWRSSCLQCHAPSAELDQILFGRPSRFLPPPEIEPR